MIRRRSERCVAGDGVLAEFPSALEAVEWAREVQEAVYRGETAEVSPTTLRVAIHVGEVMIAAGDIYGDGVNIAARLQEYGEPGGIILSEAAYNLVRGKYGPQARDLGFLNLRNFTRRFRACGSRIFHMDAPMVAYTKLSAALTWTADLLHVSTL